MAATAHGLCELPTRPRRTHVWYGGRWLLGAIPRELRSGSLAEPGSVLTVRATRWWRGNAEQHGHTQVLIPIVGAHRQPHLRVKRIRWVARQPAAPRGAANVWGKAVHSWLDRLGISVGA